VAFSRILQDSECFFKDKVLQPPISRIWFTPAEETLGVIPYTFAHFIRVLNQKEMYIFVYNIIVGNQIIVRGLDPAAVIAILNLGRLLLPAPCYRLIPFTDTYHEIYECNFLGLNKEYIVTIPSHVDQESYGLLEIDTNEMSMDIKKVAVRGNVKQTTLGTDIVNILFSEIPDDLKPARIECLLEDWFIKAKVFFKFSKMAEANDETNVRQFLDILKLKDYDLPVLKFWMTGLKKILF